jgi:hypothetical protein
VSVACPGCGERSTEDYDGSGTCWRCFSEPDTGGLSENNHEPFTPSSTWWPINLAPIVAGLQAGEIVGPVPQLTPRTDGPCLLYPGEIHSLAGEPETGKGWIALAAAAAVIANGGHVLYVDCEDAPASIVSRLLALGAPPDAILDRFTYIRPSDPFTTATLDALLAKRTYTLAIIDGLSEAYTLLGLDPYSNVDAAKFLATLARPIADAGTAVLLIDHVVKAKDGRGRYALGAQHKLAGIAVAYSTDAIRTPSRTNAGLIKLKIEKDRHGHVRSHAIADVIALAHITPDNDGENVAVTLEPPDNSVNDAGEFRPTVLMGRVWEYINDEPGASRNTIRDTVKGRGEWVDQALTLLITEGYIDRRKEGKSYAHYSLSDYQNPPFPTVSQPSPGNGSPTVSHGSPPLRGPGHGNEHPGPTNRVP